MKMLGQEKRKQMRKKIMAPVSLVQCVKNSALFVHGRAASMYNRVGPLRRNFFFQNAHSSGLATDVESKIPPNQTDIGPHKKSCQG